MISRALLLSVLCLFFFVSAFAVPLHTPKNAIPNKYIVVFKSDSSQEDRNQHISKLMSLIETQKGATLLKSYNIGDSFHAYHAELSNSILKELLKEDHVVDFIEADSMRFANQETCYLQRSATWGLDRINNQALILDNTYTYQVTNTAVDAFIVDTGIYIQHQDFNGRAIWGANFADNQNTDCNGHGTHVSGTVGSTTYGVSKNVTLIAVKVLSCDGSGTNSGVIEGVQFVTNNKKKGRPAVANMSLGGSKSAALNAAVNAAVKAGVVFAVAAGNENQDACNTSPASAASVISTGATTVSTSGFSTQIDQRASFSNYGTCVDIFAPGQAITSTWIGSPTAIETISGTSMASPHVAGAAAVYLESVDPSATPAEVAAALTSGATTNLITLACGSSAECNKSPNRLLYVPCN